ncbi:DCD1_3 [Blepharisma stoltei]|uniref:dCMP deaminase n=1 Tax=Blepharisma stoltei TaxID=1481888 RepID=A0AAU9JSL6_9CILI|nr:unnamed protein product [Blepharisma stoltei]
MVIVGITGTLSAGKETAAQYLQVVHGFHIVNLENKKWEENIPRDDFETEESFRAAIATQALKMIMSDWTQHYIVYPITLPEELLIFRKRSYFMLIGLDAPIRSRYANYCKKHGKPKNQLQGFLHMDDHTKFGHDGYPCRIHECLLSADRIIQNKGTLEELYLQLRMLDSLNIEHVRPSWDTYFIRLAEMASTRSSCMNYRSGCVLVQNKSIISTGYNGTPTNTLNCNEGGCDACNRGEDTEDCICIHSEMNALLEAGRQKASGGTIYCTHFPCLGCAKSILQSGIVRVVYSRIDSLNSTIEQLFINAGVQVAWKPPAIVADIQISENLAPTND